MTDPLDYSKDKELYTEYQITFVHKFVHLVLFVEFCITLFLTIIIKFLMPLSLSIFPKKDPELELFYSEVLYPLFIVVFTISFIPLLCYIIFFRRQMTENSVRDHALEFQQTFYPFLSLDDEKSRTFLFKQFLVGELALILLLLVLNLFFFSIITLFYALLFGIMIIVIVLTYLSIGYLRIKRVVM